MSSQLQERELPPERPIDSGSQALSEALKSSFFVVKILMGLLVIVFIGSGFFTVGPNERAIKLFLGRPVGQGDKALLGPGPHLAWPYPIGEYQKVPITGIQRVTSRAGWYAVTPEQELAGIEPPAMGPMNPAVDGYALTADGNIVHTRATLTYTIKDPVRYTFNFVNASNAVLNALDDAVLYTAAHFKVDDILTRDVAGYGEAVRSRVRELVERQDLGIRVEQCIPQSVPPRQLKDAFNSVLRSEVGRSKTLNEANSSANQTLSKASAEAQARVNKAEVDRALYVNDIASRAQQFEQLLPKYRENPKLFVEQRYAETIGRVFTNVQDKIMVPDSTSGNPKELRYILNRELQVPKAPEKP
jgi:regulator of protease activity HflC (stomatin/prohibitin superfamily)